jgi:hypothetical protein
MKDLSKLGPFREKNGKQIFRHRLEFFKTCLRKKEFRLFFEYLIFFQSIYVVTYESPRQANDAWFIHQTCRWNRKLITRHRKIWKLWHDPAILTMVGDA